jgi:hypothetical protein
MKSSQWGGRRAEKRTRIPTSGDVEVSKATNSSVNAPSLAICAIEGVWWVLICWTVEVDVGQYIDALVDAPKRG